MRVLTAPGSKILEYQGDLYKLLATHKNRGYDKENLGHLVRYYGGNKILQSHEELLICIKIEEAEIATD